MKAPFSCKVQKMRFHLKMRALLTLLPFLFSVILQYLYFTANLCTMKMELKHSECAQFCLANENHQKAFLKILWYNMFHKRME